MNSLPTPVAALVTRFTTTNLGRTVAHAVLAFVGALIPQLQWTSAPALKASLIAAVPAFLAVVYRVVFPNPPAVVADLRSALDALQSISPSPFPDAVPDAVVVRPAVDTSPIDPSPPAPAATPPTS